MVISISNTNTVVEFEFEPASPMIVMEDTVGYVPSHAQVPSVAAQTTRVVAQTAPVAA